MGIFSRTRDIIAANMTELLDKSEDPSKLIRMIIMEMEETLVEVRSGAARTIADQKEMRRAVARAEAAAESWAEKAELALSKGREDLATAALVERAKARNFAESTLQDVIALDEHLSANEEDIRKLEAKLREARQRQNALLARIESADSRTKMRAMYKGPRIEDAFAKFEIIERRADMAEGRADALSLGGPLASLEDEIAGLRTDDGVAAELAAMKARLAAANSKNEG
ncbi:phage shock protein PspA [Polymorphobacter arshaanensis]|uniref:Phage shock protein PspA n=1 Tax=Glacieibacterium arshaanense TaxID=2511025 RepID=A0A4Y9EK63_9SPHN|nr:phage shock protein PspA [Polymorphobacter arshaanensis]TFU01131.1 phage shock protein PspA [Polymorphobacter arshaanensis]